MSQTVAEALVDVLERVGVKQVFGLIGDSLNPLGDAIRRRSNGSVCDTKKGLRWPPPDKRSLPAASRCALERQAQAAIIS
jgi:hypothetical protein